MSADIKVRVRNRDNNRCAKCGIGASLHFKERGYNLEVHRLLPGIQYKYQDWCVTLCHRCHMTMPRKGDEIIYWEHTGDCGVTGLMVNDFHPDRDAIADEIEKFISKLKRKYKGIAVTEVGNARHRAAEKEEQEKAYNYCI